MLRIRKLRTALVGPFDLDLAQGAVAAIEGPSGSGKSLFLRAVADLDPADGEVGLDGTPRAAIAADVWRRRVALVPAETGWWGERVGEHFEDTADDDLRSTLAALDLASDVLDWPVARLSTGERQRLGLVRALALKPQVLLLDEPTAALDETTTAKVECLILRHVAAGACAIVVSHDPRQPGRLGAKRYEMAAGKLIDSEREA